MSTAAFRRLEPGDPFPWFRQRNTSNPAFVFDSVGGRYIVLCFFGSAATEAGARRAAVATHHRGLFDDTFCAFFGVSLDPQDEARGRVAESLPGVRHFWDFDGHVSRLCGALPIERAAAGAEPFNPFWVILNPDLHVRLEATPPARCSRGTCRHGAGHGRPRRRLGTGRAPLLRRRPAPGGIAARGTERRFTAARRRPHLPRLHRLVCIGNSAGMRRRAAPAASPVATRLAVTMTLPRLRSTDAMVAADFRRYYPALLRHEEGHRGRARGVAEAIDRRIETLPPMERCADLEREANRVGHGLVDDARQREIEYERSTRQGCTQGALTP
jgi:peroxiredoxin